MKPIRPLPFLAAMLVLGGCGTKTPLTLPTPAQPAVKGTAAPTPAPATAGKATESGR